MFKRVGTYTDYVRGPIFFLFEFFATDDHFPDEISTNLFKRI